MLYWSFRRGCCLGTLAIVLTWHTAILLKVMLLESPECGTHSLSAPHLTKLDKVLLYQWQCFYIFLFQIQQILQNILYTAAGIFICAIQLFNYKIIHSIHTYIISVAHKPTTSISSPHIIPFSSKYTVHTLYSTWIHKYCIWTSKIISSFEEEIERWRKRKGVSISGITIRC